MRRAGALWAWAALAPLLLGCGPADGGSCPGDDAPTACPSPAPSFMGEVQSIIQAKCTTCHAPGGIEARFPLVTYQQIKVEADPGTMYRQVLTCRMPQAGAPPLTDVERQALLTWLFCGAPNN
jgi:uncharacterized membrane protein